MVRKAITTLKKATVGVAVVLIAAAVAVGCAVNDDSGGSGATLQVGDTAPAFTLPNALDGEQVSLSGYSGMPVVVVFYRSFFCTFCKRQINEINDNYEEFRERGIEVLAISSDDINSVSAQLIRGDPEKYQFPILYTSLDEQVPAAYGRIGNVRDGGYLGGAELADPGVFLINGDGELAWSELGRSIGHFVRAEEVLEEVTANGL